MNRFAKLGAPLVAACALLTGWPALAAKDKGQE